MLKYIWKSNQLPSCSFALSYSSNIVVVNVSGNWVELVDKAVVLGSVGEVISVQLDEVLFLDLENIVVVDISAHWVDLIDEGVVLGAVGKIISAELHEVLRLNLEDVVVVNFLIRYFYQCLVVQTS